MITILALIAIAALCLFFLKSKNKGASDADITPTETVYTLPEGLSLPLPDKEEYWNVQIFWPEELGMSQLQYGLWDAFEKTTIDENWSAISTYDGYETRTALNFLKGRSYTMIGDLRVDIVLVFPADGDYLNDIIDKYAEDGVPVYVFSSRDSEGIISEWTRLFEG